MPRSALAPQAADAAHPAFSNLFVETEFVPDLGALLATRRKRSEEEPSVWLAHVLVVEGDTVGDLRIRNRSRAISRARPRNPRQSGVDRGRQAALRHGRFGARSDR